MEGKLRWKTIFDGRWPFMEDSLSWKTTFDGRQPLMEEDLWQKTIFDLRWTKIFYKPKNFFRPNIIFATTFFAGQKIVRQNFFGNLDNPKMTKPIHICQIKPVKPNLSSQIYQTKPSKPSLPIQTYETNSTKPNLQNQTYQTKPTKTNQNFQRSKSKVPKLNSCAKFNWIKASQV